MEYKVGTIESDFEHANLYSRGICNYKIQFEEKTGLDYDLKEFLRCDGILNETVLVDVLQEFKVSISLINEVYIQHSPF